MAVDTRKALRIGWAYICSASSHLSQTLHSKWSLTSFLSLYMCVPDLTLIPSILSFVLVGLAPRENRTLDVMSRHFCSITWHPFFVWFICLYNQSWLGMLKSQCSMFNIEYQHPHVITRNRGCLLGCVQGLIYVFISFVCCLLWVVLIACSDSFTVSIDFHNCTIGTTSACCIAYNTPDFSLWLWS